jgi:hypothetical protein
VQVRGSIVALALLGALRLAIADARAFDEGKYPDWRGQWVRVGSTAFDPTRPAGPGQEPPLTPEHQAIWQARLADQAAGVPLPKLQSDCFPAGMPRMMVLQAPMEIIVTPEITYIHIAHLSDLRRIYTDGRDWPADLEAAYAGNSIGRWEDNSGGGRYGALRIETRGFKGPRVFEASGIPLHRDNATVVKERLALDPADADVLVNEITTIDNALTRPWTVTRKYRRERDPTWVEYACADNSRNVSIGGETYVINADGRLAPAKKDQRPPDLRHFNTGRK